MADYPSKYKGSKIDEILDSVAGKQEKLVAGTNIKGGSNVTVTGGNGQPIVISATGGGGGGGGTSDYTQLENKPKINSNELSGDKTAAQLGLAAKNHTHAQTDIDNLSSDLAAKANKSDLVIEKQLSIGSLYINGMGDLSSQVSEQKTSAPIPVKKGGIVSIKHNYNCNIYFTTSYSAGASFTSRGTIYAGDYESKTNTSGSDGYFFLVASSSSDYDHVADGVYKTNVADAVVELDNSLTDLAQKVRHTIVPTNNSYAINEEDGEVTIHWEDETNVLALDLTNDSKYEVIIYFYGGKVSGIDASTPHIGDIPEFSADALYVASILDGIVAVSEIKTEEE